VDDETPEDKGLDREIKSLQARAEKAANLQKEVLKLKGELEKMKGEVEFLKPYMHVKELLEKYSGLKSSSVSTVGGKIRLCFQVELWSHKVDIRWFLSEQDLGTVSTAELKGLINEIDGLIKDYEELKAILPEVSKLVSLVEPSDKK